MHLGNHDILDLFPSFELKKRHEIEHFSCALIKDSPEKYFGVIY